MKVSIIIATYGEDSWQELAYARAKPSAEAQDPYEMIVGHEKDATIATVRNALGAKATGDWLCFLDADDELGRNYLVAMRRALEQERGTDEAPLLLTPAVSYVRKGGQPMPPKFFPIGDFRNDNYIVVGTLVERELFLISGGR